MNGEGHIKACKPYQQLREALTQLQLPDVPMGRLQPLHQLLGLPALCGHHSVAVHVGGAAPQEQLRHLFLMLGALLIAARTITDIQVKTVIDLDASW